MSNNIKLRTLDSNKFGQANKVPFLGRIEISSTGLIEVDEDLKKEARSLVEMEIGFFFADELDKAEKEKKKKEEKDKIAPQVEKSDIGKGEQKDSIKPQTEDSLELASTVEKGEIEEVVDGKLTEEEKSLMIEALEDKSFEELKALAAEFPKEEWTSYRNRIHLKPYLAKKINEM